MSVSLFVELGLERQHACSALLFERGGGMVALHYVDPKCRMGKI